MTSGMRVVLALAATQAVTALWLYGRLPGVTGAPRWLGRVHRTTGFVAFALSLPVAAYCVYGFGFAPAPLSPRTCSVTCSELTTLPDRRDRSAASTLR